MVLQINICKALGYDAYKRKDNLSDKPRWCSTACGLHTLCVINTCTSKDYDTKMFVNTLIYAMNS